MKLHSCSESLENAEFNTVLRGVTFLRILTVTSNVFLSLASPYEYAQVKSFFCRIRWVYCYSFIFVKADKGHSTSRNCSIVIADQCELMKLHYKMDFLCLMLSCSSTFWTSCPEWCINLHWDRRKTVYTFFSQICSLSTVMQENNCEKLLLLLLLFESGAKSVLRLRLLERLGQKP